MFYDYETCNTAGVKNNVYDGKVALADKDIKSKIMGKARADLVLGNEKFLCKNVEFTLLNNLVKDVIILIMM